VTLHLGCSSQTACRPVPPRPQTIRFLASCLSTRLISLSA
jgi:hypothetical protein